MLADMRSRGVERVDCFSVDNALVRPASPAFVGACAQHDCDCGAPSSAGLEMLCAATI